MRERSRWMRLVLLCLMPLAASVAAPPRNETYQLDAKRSHAGFEVKVLWFIGVHGEFGAVHGDLHIDHFRGTARVDARINTDDLRMRNDHYTRWARSAEFFDAGKYPQIHFVSTDFPLVRMRDGGGVPGELTIRGITRKVRLHLQQTSCGQPLDGHCAARAQSVIRRSEFGMRAHRHTLSDDVRLQLSIYVLPPRRVSAP